MGDIKMNITDLEKLACEIRYKMAEIAYKTKRGHLSSALSSVEIILALYCGGVMRYDAEIPSWKNRDRFILSKGHSGLALYMVLQYLNIISGKELDDFAGAESEFSTHPVCNINKGIEMSAGSLGHGLAFAIGHAYNAKLEECDYHVYVLVGDGELQEGSNWEALLLASALKLDNLTVIIDKNGLQLSDYTEAIVPLGDLKGKFSAFGFEVLEVNGHDFEELEKAFSCSVKRPKAIIANTHKGRGLSFMEDKNGWHGRGLSDDDWEITQRELKYD